MESLNKMMYSVTQGIAARWMAVAGSESGRTMRVGGRRLPKLLVTSRVTELMQKVAKEEEFVSSPACHFRASSSLSHKEVPVFTTRYRSGVALVVDGGGTLLRCHCGGIRGAMRKLLKVAKMAFL